MRRSLAAAVALAVLASTAPACASTLVTWSTSSPLVAGSPFNKTASGQPRPSQLPVNVLLPDGWSPRRAYPVLYLLHGHGDAYDSWATPKNGDVARIAAGFPGIIVMPEGGRGWYTNWWNGPAWETYHLDELIPLVEKRLKIAPGRANHAIAGLSMGGEGAMYYAEQRPGYFGSVASFSGAISILRPEWPTAFDSQGESHTMVFGDPQAQRFNWVGHDPTSLAGNLRFTRVFVTVGDGTTTMPDEASNWFGAVAEVELRQHAADFVAAARDAGVDVTYRPRDGVHDWPYWRQHLAAAIRWGFFKPVPEAPTAWRYTTVAQHGAAWDTTFTFAARPTTLVTFTRHGDRLDASGAGVVRLRFAGRPKPVVAQLPFADLRVPAKPRPRRSRPCARSGPSHVQRSPRARAPRACRRGARRAAP